MELVLIRWDETHSGQQTFGSTSTLLVGQTFKPASSFASVYSWNIMYLAQWLYNRAQRFLEKMIYNAVSNWKVLNSVLLELWEVVSNTYEEVGEGEKRVQRRTQVAVG